MINTSPPWVLGAGSLSSAAIRIFRANPLPFAAAILLPWLLSLALTRLLPVDQVDVATIESVGAFAQILGASLPAMLAALIPWVLTIVPITLMAFNAAAGRPVRLAEAYAGMVPILGRALALTLLQTLALAAVMGCVLMLGVIKLPTLVTVVAAGAMSLWLIAVLIAAMPALVAGAGPVAAIRRSATLTKGYRWPVIGALMALILFVIVTLLALLALVMVLSAVIGGTLPAIVQLAVDAVATTVAAPIYILPALIYLRLLDMKEGGDPGQIAEVFE